MCGLGSVWHIPTTAEGKDRGTTKGKAAKLLHPSFSLTFSHIISTGISHLYGHTMEVPPKTTSVRR
jgi:hypothetical protein